MREEKDVSHPPFNESYRGTPPWDIGRPQEAFVKLVRESEIHGRVLDAGCGTGESAIFYSQSGFDAWGLDSAPLAIERAEEKARERGSTAKFVLGDALHLDSLGVKFDTITDCGLFHVFSDPERSLYESSLRAVLNPGGTYFMLCFSPKEPMDWGGPRRVSEGEIRETFRDGWDVNYVRDAKIETVFHQDGGNGFLSSISKSGTWTRKQTKTPTS